MRYLVNQGVLPDIPKRAQSLRLANRSRSDPPETVFLLSTGVMRDIHTMIHNIGGYPHYASGYLSIKKDGGGQFYRTATPIQTTGREPPGGFLE